MLSSVRFDQNDVSIIKKIHAIYSGIVSEPTKLYAIITNIIIGLGVFLRLRQYAVNRSFWIDEASLALNIVNRSFGGLMRPLNYVQGAPIGFLFFQKAIILTLGNRDYILRLLPFFASLLSLLVMSELAKMVLGKKSAILCLFWFAISGQLIFYASVLKQYSSDVLITLLLLYASYKCFEANASLSRFVFLGCVGLISIFFSHPSIFILTSSFFVLLLDSCLKKDLRKLKWMMIIVFVHIIVFSLLYLYSLRFLAANTDLLRYWQFGFMPIPPWKDITWLQNAFIAMFHDPGGFEIGSLVAGAFVLGIGSFLLRRWQLGLVFSLPFLEVLIASGLEKYPFADRMLLFILPVILLLVAEGLERFSMVFNKINPWVSFGVWAILALLISITPITNGVDIFLHPKYVEHIKPVLTYLTDHVSEGDIVYIYYGAQPAFDYYSAYFNNLKDLNVYKGIGWSEQEPEQYIKDIDKLEGNKRVWFLFSHNCFWCPENEEKYILSHLNRIGRRYDKFKSIGASVYLYNLDK